VAKTPPANSSFKILIPPSPVKAGDRFRKAVDIKNGHPLMVTAKVQQAAQWYRQAQHAMKARKRRTGLTDI